LDPREFSELILSPLAKGWVGGSGWDCWINQQSQL